MILTKLSLASLVIYSLYGLPHGISLQLSTSEAGPTQSSPPYIADTVSFLLFDLVPSPHVLEHSPKLHSPHSQSAMREINAYRVIIRPIKIINLKDNSKQKPYKYQHWEKMHLRL